MISKLWNHSGFRKYFSNTSWLFGEKVLRMGVSLFVGIWVARYLGPEQFGLFSYAQALVGIFAIIATLGLDGIVVRELVKDESQRDVLLGTAFGLKFIGAFIVLSVLGIAVNFTSNDKFTNVLVFVIASAVVFKSFNVIDFYFQSKVLSRYVAFANTISLFLSSIVKILLILNNAPLIDFAFVVLFDSFVLSCGLLYFYFKNNMSCRHWKFENTVALGLLKDSWPLIFSGMVLMVQARIDQVMLKEMRGNVEVGYYSVALRLLETFGFIPMMLKSSLLPSIISARNRSRELYLDRMLNYYRLNFLLFLITAIPIFIFSEQIVVLLLGTRYQPAGVLLAIMSIRLLFSNMGVARGAYILTENLLKFALVTMVLGTITNIGLNYLWIGPYGAKGAIFASIVSFFVTTFLCDAFYSKTKGNLRLMLKSMFSFHKVTLDLSGT